MNEWDNARRPFLVRSGGGGDLAEERCDYCLFDFFSDDDDDDGGDDE
jgi:hypothetical protein